MDKWLSRVLIREPISQQVLSPDLTQAYRNYLEVRIRFLLERFRKSPGFPGVLCWLSGSHLPCEMEVCTAKKSDIINRLPGVRVPVDEQFFGK